MTTTELYRLCVDLCRLAYGTSRQNDQQWAKWVTKRLKLREFTDIVPVIADDSEAFAASRNGNRFYVFRGTSTCFDWLTDLKSITRTDGPWRTMRTRVHAGFARHLEVILPRLTADAATANCEVHITGHSLGGAAATLFAAQLLDRHRDVRSLITFGAPRVGCPTFAELLDLEMSLDRRHMVRFVNLLDPVPLIPTVWRFRHAGKPMYFSRDGSCKVAPSMSWMLYDRAMAVLSGRLKSGSTMAFHSIAGYRERIRKHF